MMYRPFRAPLMLALVVLAACASGEAPQSDSTEVDLDAERVLLRAADERYTATMDAGDVEGIVSLYAPDATRYPPNGDPTHGLDRMRAFAEGVSSTPGFSLTAQPIALEVAASGDLGYTLNRLELTVTGADGEPAVQWLRDFHIWRKEADGAWRIVEDIWHVMEVAPGS